MRFLVRFMHRFGFLAEDCSVLRANEENDENSSDEIWMEYSIQSRSLIENSQTDCCAYNFAAIKTKNYLIYVAHVERGKRAWKMCRVNKQSRRKQSNYEKVTFFAFLSFLYCPSKQLTNLNNNLVKVCVMHSNVWAITFYVFYVIWSGAELNRAEPSP